MLIHPAVSAALAQKNPVVALESTLITHGMPYPRNVATALDMEGAIRDAGATPATVGIVAGDLLVGMDGDQIDRLARQKQVAKVSLRDFGPVLASGAWGGTTVAATMFAAFRAGIEVFATGGIGGVHRGAEVSWDVSADLTALSRYPVAVVTAGIKAILDIPRTLEQLETLGVPVIGFQTDEFPAFYTRRSGARLSWSVRDAAAAAAALRAHWGAGLKSGVVIANPIAEDDEADREMISQTIDEALESASRAGIGGNDVTPFLLEYLADHTQGASLESNVALALNNALVAADIAVALTHDARAEPGGG